MNSKKVKAINLDIHIYYAAVSGSVTNVISKGFFDKYLKLEKDRIAFLKKNDLLDAYMNDKFYVYFKNWYLKKLTRIKKEDLKDSIESLYIIYSLYKDYIKEMDEDLLRFDELYQNKEFDKMAKSF